MQEEQRRKPWLKRAELRLSRASVGGAGLENKGQQAGRREWRERTEKAKAGLGT